MQKRRVVHILPGLGLGGTEKVGQLIACGLDPAAFEVAVYSPTDGPRGDFIRAAGIPLIIHKDMTALVRTFAPDILHIHRAGWPDPAMVRQIRGALRYNADGTRRTAIVETNVFGRFDGSSGARLLDCTVFVSHFCARRYGAMHGVDIALPRYTTIYNPVEADFLAAHTSSPQERDYSLPVVGRLSRADKGKWSSLALDMLPLLIKRVPAVRYAIVGGIDSARDYVRDNALEGVVEFLPPVENLPQLAHFLDGLSVFAHANDTGESFGLVIAEAMAAGLPVVTHSCPLPKDNAQVELVEHGVTGLVADTASEYADAVAWLMQHPEEARRMGMAGQAKAKALYNVPVVVRQWEALYAALCPLPELRGNFQSNLAAVSASTQARAAGAGAEPCAASAPVARVVAAPAIPSVPVVIASSAPIIQPYSAQVLQWQLGQGSALPLPIEDPTKARKAAARLVSSAARAGHSYVVLLGLGDGTMARALCETVPATCNLVVLEDTPAVARVVLAHSPELCPHVLVDTSPWALFILCQSLGISSGQCSLGYNPAYPRNVDTGGQQMSILEQWRRLFLGAQRLSLPEASSGVPSCPRLTVACIAHPAESMLPEFFSHIPPWVHELVVVWDTASPATMPPCSVPVRQLIRPLNGDFSAQRNAMLALCTGDWCLYLDVDERLETATWQAIPSWLSLSTTGQPTLSTTGQPTKSLESTDQQAEKEQSVGAIVLPRQTFMGDDAHVRMGYGLWPDVQMRLFPLQEGLHFVGAVHEKLAGVQGSTLLMGGHNILHYSHIRKDATTLQERLQVFNAACSQTAPQHVLSVAYPRLPVGYFSALHLLHGAWRLPL